MHGEGGKRTFGLLLLHASESGCSTATARLPSKACAPLSWCSSAERKAAHALRRSVASLLRPQDSF